MCGPEITDRPRGGALAALSPPTTSDHVAAILRGDLAFHTPGSPASNTATHARLTPTSLSDMSGLSDLQLIIQ